MADGRARHESPGIVWESRYTAVLIDSAPSLHDIPGLMTASGRALSPPTMENLERALELLDARVQQHDNELVEYLGLSSPTTTNFVEEEPIDPEKFQLEE